MLLQQEQRSGADTGGRGAVMGNFIFKAKSCYIMCVHWMEESRREGKLVMQKEERGTIGMWSPEGIEGSGVKCIHRWRVDLGQQQRESL